MQKTANIAWESVKTFQDGDAIVTVRKGRSGKYDRYSLMMGSLRPTEGTLKPSAYIPVRVDPAACSPESIQFERDLTAVYSGLIQQAVDFIEAALMEQEGNLRTRHAQSRA